MKPGTLREPALDLERLALENIQVGSVNLDRKRTLETRQRFIDCIFGGLCVIENDTGECLELALYVLGQLRLAMDLTRLPRERRCKVSSLRRTHH